MNGVGGWLDPFHDLVMIYGYEDCYDDNDGDRHIVPCASPEERSEFAGQEKERKERHAHMYSLRTKLRQFLAVEVMAEMKPKTWKGFASSSFSEGVGLGVRVM